MSTIRVGLIDSGIDIQHPGLLNSTEECISLIDSYPNEDFTGHGTMIAGQIAGDGILKGVAPNIKLHSYKILNEKNQTRIATLIDSLKLAMEDDVDIINLSLGFYIDINTSNPDIDKLEKILLKVQEKNIIVVSSSGYEDKEKLHFPSNFKSVLSCQSLTRNGIKVNKKIIADYCLPSGDYHLETIIEKGLSEYVPIYIPIHLSHNVHPSLNAPKGYSYMVGESLAAAKLTGLIATVLSYHRRLYDKKMKKQQLLQLLDNNSFTVEGSKKPSLKDILEDLNKITSK